MYSVGDMGSSLPPVSQASKSSKSTKSSQKKKKKDSDSKKSTTKTERGSAFEGVKLVSSRSWSDATAKRNELAEEILKAMGGTSVKDAQEDQQREDAAQAIQPESAVVSHVHHGSDTC